MFQVLHCIGVGIYMTSVMSLMLFSFVQSAEVSGNVSADYNVIVNEILTMDQVVCAESPVTCRLTRVLCMYVVSGKFEVIESLQWLWKCRAVVACQSDVTNDSELAVSKSC